MYQYGLGVPLSMEKAIECYRNAAKGGSIAAERVVVNLHLKHGNLGKKLSVLPRLVFILFKSFFIALQNRDDERLVDIYKNMN